MTMKKNEIIESIELMDEIIRLQSEQIERLRKIIYLIYLKQNGRNPKSSKIEAHHNISCIIFYGNPLITIADAKEIGVKSENEIIQEKIKKIR